MTKWGIIAEAKYNTEFIEKNSQSNIIKKHNFCYSNFS